MELNESGLSPYYHDQPQPQPQPQPQQQPQQQPPQHNLTTAASPTNGILPNTPHMVYPHSVSPAAVSSPLETVRRKRGRPRKYGTPEQAAAAKKMSAAASTAASTASTSMKKGQPLAGGASSSSTKKSQLAALGSAGQGFTPHIITVAAGEVCLNMTILIIIYFSVGKIIRKEKSSLT